MQGKGKLTCLLDTAFPAGFWIAPIANKVSKETMNLSKTIFETFFREGAIYWEH